MEGGKKVSLHNFLADQKIASSWKKCILGHPIAEQQVTACCQTHSDYRPQTMPLKYCLLPDTFRLQASNNAFKVLLVARHIQTTGLKQ